MELNYLNCWIYDDGVKENVAFYGLEKCTKPSGILWKLWYLCYCKNYMVLDAPCSSVFYIEFMISIQVFISHPMGSMGENVGSISHSEYQLTP